MGCWRRRAPTSSWPRTRPSRSTASRARCAAARSRSWGRTTWPRSCSPYPPSPEVAARCVSEKPRFTGAQMTTLTQDLRDVRPGRQIIGMSLAVAATLPGLVLRAAEPQLEHHWEAFLYGLGIVGAAFLLSWAAEVAQLDVSAGLAIGLLALIAVLPEYAVDLVFAFKAGNAVQEFGPACRPPMADVESSCSLALANMTGANRLLIGIGWPMVVFIGWYRGR